MGMFDDLVPQDAPQAAGGGQTGGLFGDLVDAGTAAAVQQQQAVASRREQLRQHLPSVAGGMADSARQGLLLGWGDEAGAGLETMGGTTGSYADAVMRRRLATAAFREFHPYLAFGSEVVGSVPTMFAPWLGVSARGAQAMRAASTPGQYLAAGARTGARPGFIAGAGAADPNPNHGTGEAIIQRTFGGAVGAGIGTVAGAGVGLAGNALNAATNLRPGFRAGSDAAQMLETNAAGNPTAEAMLARQRTAIGDIARELQRDGIDPAEIVRRMLPQYRTPSGGTLTEAQREDLVARLLRGDGPTEIGTFLGVSPGVAGRMITRFNTEYRPRFEGSNLIEIIRTPSRPGEVVAAPNMTSLAYQVASSEGRGQQVAAQRLLQRQADEADNMAGLIGNTFGAENFEQFAQQYREMVQGRTRASYGAMHANNPGVILNLNEIPQLARLRQVPAFRDALEFAAQAAYIEGDDALAGAIRAGLLDSRAVDHLQRQLRLAGEGLADRTRTHILGTMRGHVLQVAEERMPEYWGTRGMFRLSMAADEALELGRTLATRAGGSGSEGWQFWRNWSAQTRAVQEEIAELTRQIQGAGPGSNALANLQRRMQMAQAEMQLLNEINDNFRRSFGAGVLDDLNRNGNANRFLTGAEARVFRERVLHILGGMPESPSAAQRAAATRAVAPFMGEIERAQLQKQTMRALYGNSDTDRRLAKRMAQNPVYQTAAGLLTMNPSRAIQGATDMISNRAKEVRYENIANLLTATEMRETFNLARLLRDQMARSHLPNAPMQGLDRLVGRLPARLQTIVRERFGGGEIRGNDLLTFLARVLSAYATTSTFGAQRQ